MKKSLLFPILFTAFVWNCASSAPIQKDFDFQRSANFREDLKKVSVANATVLSTGQAFEKKDVGISSLQSLLSSKLQEIYGAEVAGGDTLANLIKKSKLTDKWNKAIQEISSSISGETLSANLSSDSIKTLDSLISQGKIDAIAFPFVNKESSAFEKGEDLELTVFVYESKTQSLQYRAKLSPITLSQESKTLVETSPDQAKAKASAELIQSGIRFGELLQKELKPTTVVASSSEPTATNPANTSTSSTPTASSSPAPTEEQTPLDKYGPPTTFGFLAFLWLVLP